MSATALPTLPNALARALARLPVWPGSLLCAAAIDAALARRIPPDVGAALTGRHIRLAISDAALAFDLRWQDGHFVPLARSGAVPDLCISAHAWDVLQLARRAEDPDSLFFARRLTMQGDTELGLLVKNTLDALDGALFDWRELGPKRFLSWLQAVLPTVPLGRTLQPPKSAAASSAQPLALVGGPHARP